MLERCSFCQGRGWQVPGNGIGTTVCFPCDGRGWQRVETKLTAVYDSQTGQAKPVREEELRAGEGVPLASWNVLIDKIDELRIQNDELLRECNYLRDRLTEEEDGNLALHERARLAESRLKKIYELASDFSAS